MTRPKVDHHRRERPGGGVERDVTDLDQLTATAIAAGPDEARRTLETVPAATLRAVLLAEAIRRARVLLVEAKGDKARAYDLPMRERRRWQG